MDFCFSKTSPVVETAKGKLRGFHFKGVDHFYGIRYAKAKRFQMPEPVAPWEGVKDAGSYGMNCPVLSEPQPMGEVMIAHRFWPSSEHCQYLNLWTSSCDPAAKKPVMFWIHGGGYSAGSGIEQVCYDGYNLAKKDDVVVVTVNHRLNAFGYLDMSAFGEKYKNSVNVGMADLVEALRWVRDNIANFGGDPQNVTIFGQSGGGAKVTVLGQIPEADGLFHKAIVMSGVMGPGRDKNAVKGRELVLEILKHLNIPESEAQRLEKVPTAQFIWAVNRAVKSLYKQGKHVNWGPMPNDYYVCDPLEQDFTESSLRVPTMVGSVIAEFAFGPGKDIKNMTKEDSEKLVKEFYGPEGGEKILKEFGRIYPETNAAFAVDADDMFLAPTVDYVKKKGREASAPVYNYLFAKVFDYDGGKAAWHCSDIPYFFGNGEMVPVCHQENWEELQKVMRGAFVNFARTGDPNTEGLPKWEKCAGGDMVTMVFDDRCRTEVNMQDELLRLLAEYKPKFNFEFGAPADDEDDEEGGSAWIF